MNHFLITRFNLKNPYWRNQNKEYYVVSEEWLDERFEIFETYCLPSVKNQSQQNFIWLVFFDVDTPKHYINKINSINKEYNNFKPIYIDGFKELSNAVKHQIELLQSSHEDYFITTRFDNDDIIHKDFIKTIQSLYVPKPNTIIDLRRGYQVILQHPNSTEIRDFKTNYNPFLSLVTNLMDYTNIMAQNHESWKIYPNVIVNNKDHLWIQLIHNSNKLNRKLKTLKKVNKITASDFGVSIQNPKQSNFNISLYNILMLPYRWFYRLKSSIRGLLT